MHVLIIAGGIPAKESPLNGIFEWDQAKALSNLGVEVDFFAVDLRSLRRIRPWGIRHGESEGVRWHSISIPVGAIPRSLFCKVGAIALRKLYQNVFGSVDALPNIIHAHFAEIGCMASELAKKKNIPLVITEHSSALVQPVVSDELKRLVEQGYSRAACVIAVSRFLQRNIYQNTGITAKVVPNIVSGEFQCEKHMHTGMRFISVANLNPGKRIDVLLRAFAQLSDNCDDSVLEIVGDGAQRKDLEKLAEALQISGKVIFRGVLLRKDINALYKICDCFVLPSAFETFGVAYIEAMAAGLPVIATRCGGPEDFVTEENGILVDVDDEVGLKEAMLAMYSLRGKYNCEASATTTKVRFSPAVIARSLLSIYEEVLKTRK